MARSKSRKNAPENASDFAGPDANKEAIEKLAKAASEKNKKGKNTGEVADETVGMHINLIKAAELEWRELRDKASQAQGVLRNRYKVAKQDGVDVDSLKLAFRINERSSGEVISEQRNVGRYLKIMGSPLGTQWNLFENTEDEGVQALDATAAGEQAGRDGVDREQNPHQPGSELWFQWNNGWQTGQDAIASTLGRGNGAGAAAH